ncbi:MAG: ankyrin repeat domain-containing protein, partial [Candidatus Poribacteria bacterium]|nr:ankyrin repeat domain-containing protein [Candidatus Poribacteria bacterium]
MTQDLLTEAAAFARDGNLKVLEDLLAVSPAVLTERNTEGRTLLDLACRAATGDIAIPFQPGTPQQHAAVNLILKAGADPSTVDHDNWSPLHTAGMAGHSDLARRLVAAGASVESDAYGKVGGSPLSYALFY